MRIALALMALLAFAPDAGAQRTVVFGEGAPRAQTQAAVVTTGSVIVDFQGDPATCAPRGLCDVSGTVVYDPSGSGGAVTVADFRRGSSVFVHTGEGALTARVERRGADGRVHVCTDGRAASFTIATPQSRSTRVRLGLRADKENAGVPLASRCAGPLIEDVQAALPELIVPVAAMRAGDTVLDLSGQGDFAGGGLAGRVRSGVKLRIGEAQRQNLGTGGSLRRGGTRYRTVNVEYAVTGVSGSLRIDAGAAGDPFPCGALDTCGLAATLTMTPAPAAGGRGFVIATVPTRRPRRDVLAALGLRRGGDPRGIRTFGYLEFSGPGSVAAVVQRPDGPACQSDASVPGMLVEVSVRRGRLHGALTDAHGSLRTRCPGPGMSDVAGAGALASGVARGGVLRLMTGRRFATESFQGSVSSDLSIQIRRTRVSERVSRGPFG